MIPITELVNASGEKKVFVKIGKLHAVFWSLTVVSGMVFSFLLALSLTTGFGSFQIFLFSTLATLALTATLFVMTKDNLVAHTPREDLDSGKDSELSGEDSDD